MDGLELRVKDDQEPHHAIAPTIGTRCGCEQSRRLADRPSLAND